MDDQTTEDILKKTKARTELLNKMVSSPNTTNDHFDSFNSSIEYGIETFKDQQSQSRTSTPVNDNNENFPPNILQENLSVTPTPHMEEKELSSILINGASVKALRNRWEEIARLENSPITTCFNKNKATKFVSPATTIDQAFAFISQNQDYSSSPFVKFETYDKESHSDQISLSLTNCESRKCFAPELLQEKETKACLHVTDSKSMPSSLPPLPQPSLKRSIAPEPPLSHSSHSYGNINYRPITPNSDLLGSLLDDINNDLEKYKSSNIVLPNGTDCADSVSNELQHTISFYRKQGRSRRIDVPVTEIGASKILMDASTSHSMNSSNASSDIPTNDANLKRLHEQMIVQQDQILQASRALSQCRQNEHFRGSHEEVVAQRVLLIATERRRAYCLERDRVISARQGVLNTEATEPRGTLTFTYIAVRLSKDVLNMYMHQHSESRKYYFIVLIKCGEHVLHTTLADSNEGLKSGYIEFTHFIQLSGLTSDFICTVEVYGLRAPSISTLHDKSKRKTIKKIVGNSFGTSNDANSLKNLGSYSSHRSDTNGIIDPGFQKLGYVTINRTSLYRECFLMSEILYPLDGNIILKMNCSGEKTDSLDFCGFLSLYQIVSGLGSWTRFWCVLGSAQMRFWRYPEDEEKKIPSVTLDLSKCLTNVSEVTNFVASFPNSMQVDVLIESGNNPAEEIRMLFAADSPDEMNAWMVAMNKSIRFSNIWNHHSESTKSFSSSLTSSGRSSQQQKLGLKPIF